MTADPVPHNRSRLGRLISLIFHPFVVFLPVLAVILKDTPPLEAAAWLGFIGLMFLIPSFILIERARRQQRYTYQRSTRHHFYLVGEFNILICTGLALWLASSPRLVFSMVCLSIWTPLQYGVNVRLTKISAHTAIITGIVTALILLGDLHSIPLVLGAVVVVLAVAWARLVTGNHSLTQVVLGMAVSIVSVLLAFGLVALWRPL